MERFDHIYKNIAQNKTAFFVVFFVVAVVTYAILYAFDFYPEPTTEDVGDAPVTAPLPATEGQNTEAPSSADVVDTESAATMVAESAEIEVNDIGEVLLPNRIVIPQSGTDVSVLNPESLDMNDLDTALLDGVVRHPQSAHFGEAGNILIFGHSSYLPNVFNKNFQAFNGVQDLNWGDVITLYGDDGVEYTYHVSRVYRVKASETIIDNTRGKAKLTLVTCNSFGSKDDRFIVEATLAARST